MPLEHTTSAGLVPTDPYGEPPDWTLADVHSTPARTRVSYAMVLENQVISACL